MKESKYDSDLKVFGANVRRLRKAQGLSMESLADKAEMEYRQLSRIERGEANATLISLLKIAEALNVDVHLFLLRE